MGNENDSESLEVSVVATAVSSFDVWWKNAVRGVKLTALVGGVVAVVWIVLFVRDTASRYREIYLYGEQQKIARTLEETRASRKTEGEEREIAPPKGAKDLSDAAPRVHRTKKFASEKAAKDAEERAQVDLTGDGTVAGVPNAEVDKARVESGGAEGKADIVAGNTAGARWSTFGTYEVPDHGRRDARFEATINEDTGSFVPRWDVDRAGWVTWPNEIDADVRVADYSGGALHVLDVDRLAANAGWTPIAIKGKVGVRLGFDYDALRVDGAKWMPTLHLRARCYRLWKCESY